MPLVKVTSIEGYDETARLHLVERVTAAVAATLAVPSEDIAVSLEDPVPARLSGGAIVRAFLTAMEARDLCAAGLHLAEGFVMTFPGGVKFQRLAELVAWAKPRYRHVTKTIERMEDFTGPGGTGVVFCFGTLSGAWPGGEGFAGIRFADRFRLHAGKLVEQQVWNDLAEARAAQPER